MIKTRVFTVILAVMLVVCCVAEAFFIKALQIDNRSKDEQIASLQQQILDQNTQIKNISDTLSAKADEPMIRFYLPDEIYVCESQGADIYNSSVVYGINLNSYAFHWEAPIGNSRNDRFEIPVNTKPGDYEVTLHIYDLQLNELAEKTTQLHVVRDAFVSDDESSAFEVSVNPSIYSENLAEIPEIIKVISTEQDTEDGEEAAAPNVIIIFPSAYEVYSDLDATMSKVTALVDKIRSDYKTVPILIVQPAYPGNNVDEELQLDEEGNQMQKWAYAEKTMVFKLASDLEKTYIEDESVWIVPNALMTNSENSPEKVGNAIYGMLCQLISEKRIKINE